MINKNMKTGNIMIGAVKAKTKSRAASRVLSLMDEDYSYQEALKISLRENKGVGKRTLEKELNKYV
jgi:hypothetical protein